jgi:acyl dehydratase
VTWKTVGGALPTRKFGPITAEMLVRYAAASGDFNPIHYDQDYAWAAGYRDVFAQGMQLAAFLSTYVADLLGPRSVRRFGVTFRTQVWIGAVLTCSGEVTQVNPSEGGRHVVLRLALTSDDGVVAVVGESEHEVPANAWESPRSEPQTLTSQGGGQ